MWVFLAISASLFWGLSYVLNEEIYKRISVYTAICVLSLASFLITLGLAAFNGNLKSDLVAIGSSKTLAFYLLGGIFALLLAELCIGFSIVAKNATVAGLIEVSYPLFIALFSYFLFKHQITMPTVIGGMVIFLGIFIVYFFNK